MSDCFDDIFEAHRGTLRRFLIGLCRDIDQADDYLQETYLRAQAGFGGYRGGDIRAWLGTIARNVFYSHARRKSYNSEVPMDEDRPCDSTPGPGSESHLDLIAIRKAIDGLSPLLRTVLVMRHYGGYTYEQIAQEMQMPVGTAKWRVNHAIKAVRDAMGVQPSLTVSSYCRRMPLLDYLYDLLPFDRKAAVAAHLKKCEICRDSLRGLRNVASALDLIEGERKQMHIVEVGADGEPTCYCTFDLPNQSDESSEWVSFGSRVSNRLMYVLCQGEEMQFSAEPHPEMEGYCLYRARASGPIAPCERVQFVAVYGSGPEQYQLEELEGDRRRFHWNQMPSTATVTAYVQAIRLPEGAKLLACEPEPYAINTHETHTTVLWNKTLEPGERFRSAVEYSI